MGIIEESKRLLTQFVDVMTDVEVNKREIEEQSPHRIVVIDRELKSLNKEVKTLHDEIEEEFGGIAITKLKVYFDNPVSKAKILDYEAKLIELDGLKKAREQERDSYYLKS